MKVPGTGLHAELSRRRFLAAAAVAGAAVASPLSLASGAGAWTRNSSSLPEFGRPGLAFRPRFRWWWSLPYVDITAVEELQAMAGAGFSAVEVSFFNTLAGFLASSSTGVGPSAGWGTPDQRRQLATSLTTVKNLGVRLDQTLGYGWPVRTPSTGGGTEHAQLELMYGRVDLTGSQTYVGPVPAPIGDDANKHAGHLVAVTAARVLKAGPPVTEPGTPPASTTILDPASFLDLTDQLVGGPVTPPNGALPGAAVIRWDVPPGEWILFGHWSRESTFLHILHANHPPGPATPCDYFALPASEAALADIALLQIGLECQDLLVGANEYFFEDSLENSWQQLPWTDRMPEEFRQRRGYDLTRWLPLLFLQGKWEYLGTTTTPRADFDVPDGSGARLIRDFDRTVTELYIDKHVSPFQKWSAARGSTFRSQVAFGVPIDTIASARALTSMGGVVETESLAAGQTLKTLGDPAWRISLDIWRQTVSGSHQAGVNMVTTELGAHISGPVKQLYLTDYAALMAKEWAVGVSRPILHGYSYSPPGSAWPGRDSWLGAVSESWNHRTFPEWRHMPALADFFARGSYVLEQGTAVADVAIYRDAFTPNVAITRLAPLFDSVDLDRAGFNYGYLDPAGLLDDRAVGDGRLYPATAGYRALVVDERNLPGPVAQAIATAAERGLAVVLVGSAPSAGGGFRDTALEDAVVRRAMERVRRSPRTRVVPRQRDVASALLDIGVLPDAHVLTPAELLLQRRRHAAAEVYYVHNPTRSSVRPELSLLGRGRPALLDLWTGARTELGQYRHRGDRTEVTVAVGALAGIVVAVDTSAAAVRHAESSNADEVVARAGSLVFALPSERRRLTARLDDGRLIERKLTRLPASKALGPWRLIVQELGPDGAVEHVVPRTDLIDWRAISGLEGVSGIGVYETTLDLPTVGPGQGVVLVLPPAHGSIQVQIDGRTVSRDIRGDRRLEVTHFVRAGRQQLRITLATTLANEVVAQSDNPKAAGSTGVGSVTSQAYGLIGTARIEVEHRVVVAPAPGKPVTPPETEQLAATGLGNRAAVAAALLGTGALLARRMRGEQCRSDTE